MKRSKKLRLLEFLLIGVVMGVAEDLIAVSLSTGEALSWRVIGIVVLVAIPFAFVSEIVVDHPQFWEKMWPRKKDKVLPHRMKLQANLFEQMKNGSKVVELRLNDEKRQLVRVGDEVEFSLASDSTQKILTVVEGLYHFRTFKDLYNALNPSEYGGVDGDDYTQIYKYYSKEDEAKYGVLGIRISVLSGNSDMT